MGLNLKRKHQDATTEMSEQIDQLTKMKSKIEKDKSLIGNETTDVRAAVDEMGRSKVAAENADLLRQLQELETSANMLFKAKNQLTAQLDEAKRCADDESRERLALLGKYKNLEHRIDGMKEQFDEESAARDDCARMLNKSQGEADMWRSKFEIDCLARAEELEMAKTKMQARLTEAQNTVEQLNAKL